MLKALGAFFGMSHVLLNPDQTLLLVVDIQEKFKPVLFNAQDVINNTKRLIQGCNLLNVPVLVSEQYPQGLGHTVSELTQALQPDAVILEKTRFGCCDEPSIMTQIKAFERQQILVCGLEAHICVNQTVLRLLEAEYQVHLIEDAIGTRKEQNYHIALQKMTRLGAIPSCVEMALFELLGSSKHPQFKAIQKLVL